MRKLIWEEEQLNFCCGVRVLGNFETVWGDGVDIGYFDQTGVFTPNKDLAFLATTTVDQKAAIRRLKEEGFTPIATWKRDYGRRITLWFHPTKRPKPRKRTRRGQRVRRRQ